SLSTFEDVLTINYRQWGQTLTSVTGFYNFHYNLDFDQAALPGYLFTTQTPDTYHQFSQELRIASSSTQAFEYLAGVYFQSDHDDSNQAANFPALNGLLRSIPPFAPLVPYLPVGQEILDSQGERVYSLFGSLTCNATNSLKLSAGLRGSWNEKD